MREQLGAEQHRSRTLLERLEQGDVQSRHSLALMQMQYESKMRVSEEWWRGVMREVE